MRSDLSLKPKAQTGGLLFNRKDPRAPLGEVQPILDRQLQVKKDAHNYIVNEGKDPTSLHDRHRFKYRIPLTSVVNKVGDCGFFGLHLTAAQWIWVLNLFCFIAHTAMVGVTAYFAWWSKDLEKYEENPYLVKIYRVSAKWNNQTTEGYDYTIVDNGMPIDFAVGTIAFYAISAVFHFLAVLAGLFEQTWFYYWRHACTQPILSKSPNLTLLSR